MHSSTQYLVPINKSDFKNFRLLQETTSYFHFTKKWVRNHFNEL